jgi:hypothetical protein
MRGARYVRLIPWTLHSGSEHSITIGGHQHWKVCRQISDIGRIIPKPEKRCPSESFQYRIRSDICNWYILDIDLKKYWTNLIKKTLLSSEYASFLNNFHPIVRVKETLYNIHTYVHLNSIHYTTHIYAIHSTCNMFLFEELNHYFLKSCWCFKLWHFARLIFLYLINYM